MNQEQNYLIVVAGPTAVGKTEISIALATWLQTEIISADSRQIYRQLQLGTAKPTTEQLKQVKHHFINELNIEQPFTAADFETQALQRLQLIFTNQKVAILCGGTGLYISAVCQGLDKIPDVALDKRDHFENLYKKQGLKCIQQLLKTRDPAYSKTIDLNNPRRIIRALSVIDVTGQTFSSFLQKPKEPRPFEILYLLMNQGRAILYEKINARVDQMINSGLEEEVLSLRPHMRLPSLQTVGYQEWNPYFAGKIDREEVIRLIKRNSRRYAKRQMTWFKKHGPWQSFRPDQLDDIKTFIGEKIKSIGL